MNFLQRVFFSILLIKNFDFIKCSDSEESIQTKNFDARSSDDEDSVTLGFEVEDLDGAFANLKLNSSKPRSIPYELHPINQSPQSRPLSCLDGQGREVDWWFIYKEPNGLRYLYYSSLDEENGRANFHPLDRDFLINNPNNSPILKTIYHPSNLNESEVWLGWNDQPNDGKDAYLSRVCGVKHAHSKGFYAQNAVSHSENGSQVTIGSYTIMTSLPRFPNILQNPKTTGSSSLKNKLPLNQANIFDANLSANAQHFMCLSFPQHKVEMEKNGNVFEVSLNDSNLPVHVKFLTKYLKTIHPAIVGTNFDDTKAEHFIWRKYFSLLRLPYPQASVYLDSKEPVVMLKAYSKPDLPSYAELNSPKTETGHVQQHVFPLSTTMFSVEAGNKITFTQNYMKSRWSCEFSSQNGCFTGEEQACLDSFSFTTTNKQSSMELQLFAKHGKTILDLYDDWATLQLSQSQQSFENSYTGQIIDRYGLLVQSWIDSKNCLPRKPDKKIFNENVRLVSKVNIDNLSSYFMPVNNGEHVKVTTSHKDHSKWALGFALDTLNDDGEIGDNNHSFMPLFFVSDLNRTDTQARLKDKNQGRGGGIISTRNVYLWLVMMNLSPRAQKQKFATKGKSRARQLQNRLRKLTNIELNSGAFRGLPLKPFKPAIFRALRLSKQESKQSVNAIPFVPFLNEISEFICHSVHQTEHAAIVAFRRLFHRFSAGLIKNSAEIVWKRTEKDIRALKTENPEFSCLLEWSQLYNLPSLQIYRQTPKDSQWDDERLNRMEAEIETPYIYRRRKDGKLKTCSLTKSLRMRHDELVRNSFVRIDPILDDNELEDA